MATKIETTPKEMYALAFEEGIIEKVAAEKGPKRPPLQVSMPVDNWIDEGGFFKHVEGNHIRVRHANKTLSNLEFGEVD